MKPGTFTHMLAVIISSITSFFTHSAPAKILPAKEKISKKSDRTSEDSFSLLRTTTAFVPTREDPPRHAERYPWKKEIVTTVFWIGEQPTANNPIPIARVRGTKIGRTATADSTILIAVTALVTFRRISPRNRIRFIARCPTTTRPRPAIARKRLRLFHGSRTPIRVLPLARVKAAGSRSTKAIALPMRNGKMPGLFAPIIGNMFSATNAPNQI